MKKQLLKSRHPIVLTAAAMLTVFSIIGSVAAAGLIPLPESIHSVVDNKQHERTNSTEPNNNSSAKKNLLEKAEFKHDQFNSVVKPRLSNCFNCGVVVAIETSRDNSSVFDLNENQDDLFAQNIENYLDAHRENARIIALVDDLTDPTVADKSKESNRESMTYLIKVRMPDGSQHTITQDTEPKHNVGDQIRLINERTITA